MTLMHAVSSHVRSYQLHISVVLAVMLATHTTPHCHIILDGTYVSGTRLMRVLTEQQAQKHSGRDSHLCTGFSVQTRDCIRTRQLQWAYIGHEKLTGICTMLPSDNCCFVYLSASSP